LYNSLFYLSTILLIESLLLLPYAKSIPFPISLYLQFLIYSVMYLTHYFIILATIVYDVNSISNEVFYYSRMIHIEGAPSQCMLKLSKSFSKGL
jgi:hypothetical protein